MLESRGLRLTRIPHAAPWLGYEIATLPSQEFAGTVRESPGSALVRLARWLLGRPCFLGPITIHESVDDSLLMTLCPLDAWSGRSLLVWDALGTLVGRIEATADPVRPPARIRGPGVAASSPLLVERADTGFHVIAGESPLILARIHPGIEEQVGPQPPAEWELHFTEATVDQPFVRMLLLAAAIAVAERIIPPSPGSSRSGGVAYDHRRGLSATAATVAGTTAAIRASPSG